MTRPTIDPTSPGSAPSPVYQTVDGRVCERCVCCGAWTPCFGAQTIRIGRLIRRANPNLGERRTDAIPQPMPHHHAPSWVDYRSNPSAGAVYQAPVDDRETVWFPKIKVGTGCAACVAKFDQAKRDRPNAREPFIKVGEFPDHVTASRPPQRRRRPTVKVPGH